MLLLNVESDFGKLIEHEKGTGPGSSCWCVHYLLITGHGPLTGACLQKRTSERLSPTSEGLGWWGNPTKSPLKPVGPSALKPMREGTSEEVPLLIIIGPYLLWFFMWH